MLDLEIARATRDDVAAVVALLADDQLGARRENTSPEALPRYLAAFDAIDADPRNLLVVGRIDGVVRATMQLTFLPYLTHGGSERLLIEAVRIDSELRGKGVGATMLRWAIDQGQRRGCRVVQLTTDKQRGDAFRFYQRLGFVASHDGMKLWI